MLLFLTCSVLLSPLSAIADWQRQDIGSIRAIDEHSISLQTLYLWFIEILNNEHTSIG
jgi:hypothetical protein